MHDLAIPLIDSPLFLQLLESGRLGVHQALAAQLHRDGYALIDLGRERVAGLAQQIRSALAPGGALRVQDAWREVEAVRQLALEPVVLEILRCLWGREPFAFQTLNFPVGTQQHLHSDAVHFHSEPAGFMCGVWVALEDIHPDAGPLMYVPGSQRLPYLQARDVGYRQQAGITPTQEIFHEAWLAMVEAKQLRCELFTPRQGQALIWTANLLHGGSAARDPSLTRWSQVTHYFFEGCLHYTPMLSDWPQGPVAWRHPFDVATGAERPGNAENREALAEIQQTLQGFEPDRYLLANPDVAAAGVNPYEHLVRHGLAEQRSWG